jgi:phosphate transport system substrate-binding protein
LEWVSESLSSYRSAHQDANFMLDIYTLEGGVNAVEDGDVDLFIGAVEPKGSLFATPLLQDGIAVIRNSELGVRDLTLEELREIFSGSAQNWQAFDGEDAPIYPLIPLPGDGLRIIFHSRVMGNFQFSSLAQLQATPEQMINLIEKEPGAVGFVPFSHLEGDTSVFRIEGVAPTPTSIRDGRYPLSYWVTGIARKEPDGALRDWLSWVQQQDS